MTWRQPPCALLLLFGAGLLGADAKQPAKKEAPKATMTKEEQAFFDRTNEVRAKFKLPPLKSNPTLVYVARAHSVNMGKHKQMAHKLDGKDPADRADDAGYDFLDVNENIAWWGTADAGAVMKEWLESKSHRDNILGKFEEVGVGIASGPHPTKAGEKVVWITQVFGTQRKQP
jgi:uncharacterized protein YkwD